MRRVPRIRLSDCKAAPVNASAGYVLYWMIAARRTRWNFALDRAVEWARELDKPLVILEALRIGYPWASDRLHQFVIQGMRANAERLADAPVRYYPYVEREQGDGKGLLEALAADACVVVTDEFPCFFFPRMVAAAAARLPVRIEQVDGNGILPLRATEQVFSTAFAFRRFLQASLRQHLDEKPKTNPLSRIDLGPPATLPRRITSRWPIARADLLSGQHEVLARLPIDHEVRPCELTGGAVAAERRLKRFVESRLGEYDESRNQPERNGSSSLSPYLHFGHLSAHEAFWSVAKREDWTPNRLLERADGKRSGWWGMAASAEAFLDQLITWREIGFNMCAVGEGYDDYESLPDWALRTLAKHAGDPRAHVYSPAELESAATHDELWNAAQMQLRREGTIHNYLRMLWGKKILEWSESPRAALATMVDLNNKYALDGRDPNSYSGIFWCLGRYDRAWGPEREVFGTVRYMSSENTARKYRVKGYLARHRVDR